MADPLMCRFKHSDRQHWLMMQYTGAAGGLGELDLGDARGQPAGQCVG